MTDVRIGLLRAINLAGLNRVAMADLRAMCGTLGLADARTLLQSGNVLFRTRLAPGRVEQVLEKGAATHLGISTEFFVRTAAEWDAVMAANPFPDAARRDPGRLIVLFLKRPVETANVTALQQAIKGPEVVRAAGREAYIVYPDGIGRSRLTMAVIERKLGTRGTARNWNTVSKLAAMAAAG
jgi:uncharacterized protein (DUF1697 family)